MEWDFDPAKDPIDFIVWEELIDPGKPYQCPKCGQLMDQDCVEWSEGRECRVCRCPDCGAVSRIH